ncbi:helix-hairpin-helix domain-containing protein [Subtercola sp. YIM 133946]|uniref:helix-hairpin-helix domain-containing protein n=1 Tax=Subtercola sp. YIM 133946 TaxID=3118909 RepID=UPI002F95BDCD
MTPLPAQPSTSRPRSAIADSTAITIATDTDTDTDTDAIAPATDAPLSRRDARSARARSTAVASTHVDDSVSVSTRAMPSRSEIDTWNRHSAGAEATEELGMVGSGDKGSGDALELELELEPEPGPGPQRPRVRVGIGAAVVICILALVCAVLVSVFTPRGQSDTIALSAGGGTRIAASGSPSATPGVSSSAGSANDHSSSGTDGPGSAGAASGTSSAATSASASSTSTTSAAGTQAGTSQSGAVILVHVLGAVAKPGLYQLRVGDRVMDAVTAAGGFAPNADQGQQNLARVLKDAEQVVVPETGAAPPLGSVAAATSGASAGAGSSSAGAGAASGGGSAASAGAPVNINLADEPTLETLPHVGPAMAARIIAWRTENGPFTQTDDLKNVSGIGDKTFAELEPLVTV